MGGFVEEAPLAVDMSDFLCLGVITTDFFYRTENYLVMSKTNSIKRYKERLEKKTQTLKNEKKSILTTIRKAKSSDLIYTHQQPNLPLATDDPDAWPETDHVTAEDTTNHGFDCIGFWIKST